MKEFWENRYAAEEYAYGKAPNHFFKESLARLKTKGKILLPAEGEGRNAVYAARQGWEVYASDQSREAQKKAMLLAEEEGVVISYEVCDISDISQPSGFVDACALIYAHLPPPISKMAYEKIVPLIKPGGYLILEGFSKNNLARRLANPAIGGPDKVEMLYSVEDVKNSFPDFEVISLDEKEVDLDEGGYHNGKAMVIRFIGVKK